MNGFLLAVLILFQGGKPLPVKTLEGVTLHLPGEILESPELNRRLFSGLTTTIELETTVKPERGAVLRFFSFLTLRYEVWEERLLLQVVNANARVETLAFQGLEPLALWLGRNPVLIADFKSDPGSVLVKTRCRIIPFSQQEAGKTQAWFAGKLKVQASGQRGSQSRSKQRDGAGESDGPGIFEVLLTTGINTDAVKTYRWKWRFPEGA